MSNFIESMLTNPVINKDGETKYTLKKYLEEVQENPNLAALAPQRLYEAVMQHGVTEKDGEKDARLKNIYGDNIPKTYNYFKDKFFGMDQPINKIIDFLFSAAHQGEEAKQVLYLMGPAGAGKSSLVDSLKQLLETTNSIYALDGCPMHEEPLHLLPTTLREQFTKETGVSITGDLCPVCRYRLKHEFNGDYTKFPISKKHFSIAERQGIGVVPPVDPNNQDTSVLTGSIDISKMDLYPEDDPRVLSLNGAFNVGNRGIVEFIEVFKNEVQYLHTMLTATQEKQIPSPGKNAMISFDGVIIAHSNEAEWEKFQRDATNEAILDRLVKINVPYCLELDEEVKIYEKMLKNANFDVHIAPHTLEVAAIFAIMTRLVEVKDVTLVEKVKIYNGESLTIEDDDNKFVTASSLKEKAEGQNEGMFGISTRFIFKALSTAIATSKQGNITPLDVIRILTQQVKDSNFLADTKQQYIQYLQENLMAEYNKIVETEVVNAIIENKKDEIQHIFDMYVKGIEGDEAISENFMRSIEELVGGICASTRKGFRDDLKVLFNEHPGNKDYTEYSVLCEAVQKKYILNVKESLVSELINLNSKMHISISAALQDKGYSVANGQHILTYVVNQLWKA